jgi:hypothetical protein
MVDVSNINKATSHIVQFLAHVWALTITCCPVLTENPGWHVLSSVGLLSWSLVEMFLGQMISVVDFQFDLIKNVVTRGRKQKQNALCWPDHPSPNFMMCTRIPIILDSTSKYNLAKFDHIHYRGGLLVSGCIQGTSTEKVLACLGWMSLKDRRSLNTKDFRHNMLPSLSMSSIWFSPESHTVPAASNRVFEIHTGITQGLNEFFSIKFNVVNYTWEYKWLVES